MSFTSASFCALLGVTYLVYWGLGRRAQNVLLLAASYLFYSFWDWRFLSLILASSLTDYLVTRALAGTREPAARRGLLALSLMVNLGLLGFFKYFNFFVDSLETALSALGFVVPRLGLEIVLPVGISFYTFQTLGYTIDVYRGDVEARKSVLDVFVFVAFFPQLVAGPIERAGHLLPQFSSRRVFDEAQIADGARQMLWGFFKKIVIADNLAPYVNAAYGDVDGASGSQLVLATVLFAFQIYCDFSGYSDIGIGCARLLGIDLRPNFRLPYFAQSMSEFWRRWHISLSSWLTDYVYAPLTKVRLSWLGWRAKLLGCLFLTFLVSGLWHGAAWTFVAWGALHGSYLVASSLSSRWRRGVVARLRLDSFPGALAVARAGFVFVLVCISYVFFRADSLASAVQVFEKMLVDQDLRALLREALRLKALVAMLLLAEWLQRDRRHVLDLGELPLGAKVVAYNAVVLGIVVLGAFDFQPFIYFQF